MFRIGNERLTKAVVLGWCEELERRNKRTGKKRKTVMYWKRILRESLCDVSPPRGGGGGLYAGVESGTYCPPPQTRQRERQPTVVEPGYRRKTRRSSRPSSERWGRGMAALVSP